MDLGSSRTSAHALWRIAYSDRRVGDSGTRFLTLNLARNREILVQIKVPARAALSANPYTPDRECADTNIGIRNDTRIYYAQIICPPHS